MGVRRRWSVYKPIKEGALLGSQSGKMCACGDEARSMKSYLLRCFESPKCERSERKRGKNVFPPTEDVTNRTHRGGKHGKAKRGIIRGAIYGSRFVCVACLSNEGKRIGKKTKNIEA